MLVLSRKVEEQIVINNNIKIVVTKINGNRVTLGIHAPQEYRILRGELAGSQSRQENLLDKATPPGV